MRKLFLYLTVLCLGLVLVTFWRASARQTTFEAEFPPEGQFITVDGHPVHYVQLGAGPDLVLVHGASGSTRDFTFSLATKLADEFRVTMFDRPGLGYTPALSAHGVTLDAQTDLLVDAAQQLGIDAPVVVGHSFGGAVLMDWAVRHPDRLSAAVSISGAAYPWPGVLDRFHSLLARPIIGKVIAYIACAWVPRSYVQSEVEGVFAPQHAPPGYQDYIGAELNLRPESLIANAQQRTDLRPELRALSAEYSKLALPVEIIHGTADTTVGLAIHSAALERDAQNAHLQRLEGVGHMPHHIDETAVSAAIKRAAQRAGLQ